MKLTDEAFRKLCQRCRMKPQAFMPWIEKIEEGSVTLNTSRHGLGDIVAAGLAGIGITEDRVSKAIGKPCGCKQRKEWLNRVGRVIGIGQEATSAEKPVDDQPS